MLEALIAGESDPAAMADLAKRRMRSKIPALTEALTGRFTAHHGFMIRMHLNLIDHYTTALSDLDARIRKRCSRFTRGPGSAVQHPGLVDDGR